MNASKKFDAIIIGTGQAGKPLAFALAEEGWKVAIIEKDLVGGSCVNYGCTPTKTLFSSSRMAYLTKRSEDFGILSGNVRVDFNKVMERKNEIVKNFRESGERSLNKNKNIKLFFGTASFTGKKEVEIKLKNGSVKKISSDKIFINTGTLPAIPPIKGIENVKYLTSQTILELKKIPEHLIIIGGSYIGLEFAQMFRRFGSEVTVIERSEKLISREDDDVSIEIENILSEDGIKIYTSAEILEMNNSRDEKAIIKNKIEIKIRKGDSQKSIKGTSVLIAAGIKPDTQDLNLKNAGVKVDERGYIKVNSRLETDTSGIYALGDVKGGPAFTHISYDDFRIVFSNIIKKDNRSTNKRMVPYTLFIDPPLGRIGITEKEASLKKLKYKTAKLPMTHVARAIEMSETRGFMKAIIDTKTKKILGCSILGIEGGEIMAMIEIAMMGNIPYTKLRDGIFSHPTLSEALNNLFSKVN